MLWHWLASTSWILGFVFINADINATASRSSKSQIKIFVHKLCKNTWVQWRNTTVQVFVWKNKQTHKRCHSVRRHVTGYQSFVFWIFLNYTVGCFFNPETVHSFAIQIQKICDTGQSCVSVSWCMWKRANSAFLWVCSAAMLLAGITCLRGSTLAFALCC